MVCGTDGIREEGGGERKRGKNVPVPEAQRRPFFTARTSVSGPRSPRNTNKNGGLEGGKTRREGARGRVETGEIRSERGKWERRKSSAERQGGPRGGKKDDDRLDDTRPWCCRPSECFFFFPPPSPLFFHHFSPFLFSSPLRRVCALHVCRSRLLLDHAARLRPPRLQPQEPPFIRTGAIKAS